MRILVIFFIFLVPSFLSANDISEFQIEGMNVNESVLSYFHKNQIDNEKFYLYENYGPKGKEIAAIFIEDNIDRYDSVQISFKDDNYEIVSIIGNIYFEDMDNCSPLQNEISNDIKSLFSDLNFEADLEPIPHVGYPNGEVMVQSRIGFFLEKGRRSNIDLICFDISESLNKNDRLSVTVRTHENNDWLESIYNNPWITKKNN